MRALTLVFDEPEALNEGKIGSELSDLSPSNPAPPS